MKDFTCLFKVEYIGIEDKPVVECGVIPADDFRDAIEQLEGSYYGTDLVKINSMELFDTPVAVFSKEVFALVHKEIKQGV
jgi:hypothetical protein